MTSLTRGQAIHVAIVFSTREIGGAERSLTLMAGANQDLGIRYSLWSLGELGEWHRWAAIQGLDPQSASAGSGRLAQVLTLLSRLRSARPDVIYAVGLRAYVLLRLARPWLRGARVVHAIRTSFPPADSLTRRYRWAERLFPSPAAAYIANSRAGVESFLRIVPRARSRMYCVPNGVRLPKLDTSQAPIGQGVLVLANMHPLKGHLPFLEVARDVVRRDPSAHFFFVGRDDMNGKVQRRVSELGIDTHIEFAGFIPDPSDYFRRARMFVLPSRTTEGAPTSILEAHANGIPVIAYSVGGVAELVRSGVDGLVIDPKQPASMVDAILSLLQDPRRARELGTTGRERVLRELSLSACAANHGKLWRRLCGHDQGIQE